MLQKRDTVAWLFGEAYFDRANLVQEYSGVSYIFELFINFTATATKTEMLLPTIPFSR